MLELLLATIIVSKCGDSDFKTREYYTYHVRKNINYYYLPILLNSNDPEIYTRFRDLDDDYWIKVATDFKKEQEKRIKYTPWIGEHGDVNFGHYYWIEEANKKYQLNTFQDYISHRYATILYIENLIKTEKRYGYLQSYELLNKWWEEEVAWQTEHNYTPARNMDLRLSSKEP